MNPEAGKLPLRQQFGNAAACPHWLWSCYPTGDIVNITLKFCRRATVLILFAALVAHAERINHEGRILGMQLTVTNATLFNTTNADALLSSLQIFPVTNSWNEDISRRPVHPDSDAIFASVGRDKTVRVNTDMAFVLVPPTQSRVEVTIREPGESDKGPYPVPDNAPIEGWPLDGTTLEASQREGGTDRPMIVVDPVIGMLYEFFHAFKRPAGWEATLAATWDLTSNRMRPDKWCAAHR